MARALRSYNQDWNQVTNKTTNSIRQLQIKFSLEWVQCSATIFRLAHFGRRQAIRECNRNDEIAVSFRNRHVLTTRQTTYRIESWRTTNNLGTLKWPTNKTPLTNCIRQITLFHIGEIGDKWFMLQIAIEINCNDTNAYDFCVDRFASSRFSLFLLISFESLIWICTDNDCSRKQKKKKNSIAPNASVRLCGA